MPRPKAPDRKQRQRMIAGLDVLLASPGSGCLMIIRSATCSHYLPKSTWKYFGTVRDIMQMAEGCWLGSDPMFWDTVAYIAAPPPAMTLRGRHG